MMRKTLPSALFLALLVSVLPSLAQQPTTDDGYRIGARDLLEIRVFEVPDLNGERRVAPEGTISFPPLGDVPLAGLTVGAAEELIKQKLEEKYFQRATVSVQVREYRSKPISVIGAVKQPGNLGFSGRWTLLEAITAAGGLAENHGSVIYVLRRASNGLSAQVEISVADLMVAGNPRANIPIFANDLINVASTIEVTVYCLGELAQPGSVIFKSTERITLLAAIARAGGLTERASPKMVIKRTRGGTEEEIEVDFRRILGGKENDFPLQDGDVVVVKESFF
ncbi:MAG: polysaccharide biosynthesis/export family protein [Acidobacteriota bacterium]|nr:polysaccharide biosynthesis/export family protein [Acidobacteriota bacterium]